MKNEQEQLIIDRLTADARNRRISRRSFMSNSVATGITVSSAASLWGAAAQAEPKFGGTFRLGSHDGNQSDTHDPGTYTSFTTIQLAHAFRSYLTLIESDGSLGPDVAMEWSSSKTADEWTFKLNPKATFHSGAKVTVADVIASLRHHTREDSTSVVKALLGDVVELVDNGDHSITFALASGNADLPWLLTDYHLPILPARADGTANWQSGDGCGPYRLVSADFGRGFSLVRHDDWHLEGAYFDAVEILVINDPNARQAAIVTGDVDAITSVETKTASRLEAHPDIELDEVPSAAAATLPMLTDVAPFDNADVRNALKLAMNREEVIEKIAYGKALVGNDFHHSPAMPYWPNDVPQREYDPDKAKSLLRKAGLEGLEINLSTADTVFPGAVDLAVLYAEQAKAAGIKINVVREPNDGYYAEVWMKKPFIVGIWGARPTPDVMYSLAYKDDAPWNDTRWKNERFNVLLREAKAELDDAKRAEMYREMAFIMRDDGGTIVPYFPSLLSAHQKTVAHGPHVSAAFHLDGARATSRWWFAS